MQLSAVNRLANLATKGRREKLRRFLRSPEKKLQKAGDRIGDISRASCQKLRQLAFRRDEDNVKIEQA